MTFDEYGNAILSKVVREDFIDTIKKNNYKIDKDILNQKRKNYLSIHNKIFNEKNKIINEF